MVNGPGLRWALMGAHMTYHLGGGEGGMESYLSHLGASQEERWADLGTPALTPEVCEVLISGTKHNLMEEVSKTLERPGMQV